MFSLLRAPLRASAARPVLRAYSAAPPVKVPVALIAKLRAQHPISIVKAREALAAANLDIPSALEWLEKDLQAGGAAKQAKLANRTTKEGLIAVGVIGEGWGRRGGIVELNCETSFVYRTPGFTDLLQSIHHTAVFFHNPPTAPSEANPTSHLVPVSPSVISDAPLLSPNPDPSFPSTSQTAAQQITSLVTTTGEKISLARLSVFAPPTAETHEGLFYPSFFAHTPTGLPANVGTVGAFLVLHLTGPGTKAPSAQGKLLKDTEALGRALARQMVGVPCNHIYAFKGGNGEHAVVDGSDVFVEQHFMFFPGPEAEGNKSVGEVLKIWGESRDVTVRIEGGSRWVVGEGQEVEEAET
ncbi:Mitochondrial translation elongation factor EF-Tsmt, catalyzes nucleotide exchange on EF-Tumt [Phaffia rhodozyma]|uniref:Elongation factor Ts, mitochondrial n=1 Tax=Phaffia rhodozyma TaxID=264483 RepID=A0A0F7SVQ7_PHARH|nr:Mitochondrial translation elongation factor EF-Tsmt, catalyzes nucleotide exchange on EF-Tumt [Phaffia rhodozyma]